MCCLHPLTAQDFTTNHSTSSRVFCLVNRPSYCARILEQPQQPQSQPVSSLMQLITGYNMNCQIRQCLTPERLHPSSPTAQRCMATYGLQLVAVAHAEVSRGWKRVSLLGFLHVHVRPRGNPPVYDREVMAHHFYRVSHSNTWTQCCGTKYG